MPALQTKRFFASPHLNPYSVELRQRVEQLETARIDALTRRDIDNVELIDKQIAQVCTEWTECFASEVVGGWKKAG